MKKTILLLTFLLIFLTSLFSAPSVVNSISQNISAYKYSTDNIFFETTPTINFELRSPANVTIAENSDIVIPVTAVDNEIKVFNYVLSGNDKSPISVKFTFNPLKADKKIINYNVRIAPTTETIANQNFKNATVKVGHLNGSDSYLFSYKSVSPTEQTISLKKNTTSTVINYTTTINTTPSLPFNVNHAIIDHWVRQGSVYITIPSSSNTDIQQGRYSGDLVITITSGS